MLVDINLSKNVVYSIYIIKRIMIQRAFEYLLQYYLRFNFFTIQWVQFTMILEIK